MENAGQDHSNTGKCCRLLLALLNERGSTHTMRARTHRQSTRSLIVSPRAASQDARYTKAKCATVHACDTKVSSNAAVNNAKSRAAVQERTYRRQSHTSPSEQHSRLTQAEGAGQDLINILLLHSIAICNANGSTIPSAVAPASAKGEETVLFARTSPKSADSPQTRHAAAHPSNEVVAHQLVPRMHPFAFA